MTEKIATLIVDDYDYFRKILSEYLLGIDFISVIGETKNGTEAVVAVEKLKPRLIIMDTGVPTMDGVLAYDIIKTRNPDIKIIFCNMYEINPFGSSGLGKSEICISKDRLFEELPPVIEKVKKEMGL